MWSVSHYITVMPSKDTAQNQTFLKVSLSRKGSREGKRALQRPVPMKR